MGLVLVHLDLLHGVFVATPCRVLQRRHQCLNKQRNPIHLFLQECVMATQCLDLSRSYPLRPFSLIWYLVWTCLEEFRNNLKFFSVCPCSSSANFWIFYSV